MKFRVLLTYAPSDMWRDILLRNVCRMHGHVLDRAPIPDDASQVLKDAVTRVMSAGVCASAEVELLADGSLRVLSVALLGGEA